MPELRAEHLAVLAVLRRQLLASPADPLHWRRFVIVAVAVVVADPAPG